MTEFNPYAPPESDPLPPPSVIGGAPLATRGQRLGAFVIDWLIVLGIVSAIRVYAGDYDVTVVNGGSGRFYSMQTTPFWSAVATAIWLVLNSPFLQRGQSIGKKLLKLQIQRLNGSKITASHIVINRVLPIALLSLIPQVGGLIALVDVLLIFREKRNTLHDDIARTKVVQLVG